MLGTTLHLLLGLDRDASLLSKFNVEADSAWYQQLGVSKEVLAFRLET